jgi:large subunit ribosomal protein L25
MAFALDAETRTVVGSREMKKIRAAGKVPAVVYGNKEASLPIAVDVFALNRLVHSGEHIVDLKIDGNVRQTLLKAVQWDAFGEVVLHADFNLIRKDQVITVNVPIRIKGTPKGTTMGGQLITVLHDLHISCIPSLVPDHIDVDVSALDVGHVMHVRDVSLPEGLKATNPADDVIASCELPRGEVEAAPAPTEGEAEAAPAPEKKE